MTQFDFSAFPQLETERLILRRITMADVDDWQAVWDNEQVLHYISDFDGIPDRDEIVDVVEWADRIFANRNGMRWAITLKPSDTMIGSCGFHVYEKNNRYAEIGYELHQDYWRKGITLEAVRELLRFCFEELNLHRVSADVTGGNDASAGLLRRAGFTHEGTWRDRIYKNDTFHDLWQFGLLEDEYRSKAF